MMRQRSNNSYTLGKDPPPSSANSFTSRRSPTARAVHKGRKSLLMVSIVLLFFNLVFLSLNLMTFQLANNKNAPSLRSSNAPCRDDALAIPHHEDGPPTDLIVHGKRDFYTPVPPQYRKTAWLGETDDSHLKRAFRSQGWSISKEEGEFKLPQFHILYKRRTDNARTMFAVGDPWQRISRVPSSQVMESKDGLLKGLQDVQKRHDNDPSIKTKKDLMYFIPETYRLADRANRNAFSQTIQNDKAKGRHRPWVLKKVKVNNGKGIEMIPPDSSALYSAVQRSQDDKENDYVIQSYICNELTWFDGEKFDLRFYWLVASVDPLIVLYHDGYARVGGAKYNETDWGSTGQHLTNHEFRPSGQEDVLADALWRRIREYHQANKARLASKLKAAGGDPIRHVRNQMKEAISTTALAFHDTLSLKDRPSRNLPPVATENMFALYGADFIIDADLDVYYVEAQVVPGMGDGYDFRIELFRDLLRPMIHTVEEIAIKQEKDAKANLLPLENLGGYEIVYAGEEWRYEYKGYQRSADKKGCTLSPALKQ